MSNTFCILPWIHLATHPNGGVSLCCRSNHKDAISWAKQSSSQNLLTLENNKLSEIINSDKFVEVRQAMLNGERPIECEGCWLDEEAGIESKRQYENKRWSHIVSTIERSAVISSPSYRYVELRLGNVCNNACLTCNSYSSSKWYPDEKKISEKLPWFKLRPLEQYKWFDNIEFYNDLSANSHDVEEIYINGGEPTLIKAHFKYLENLIDTKRSNHIHLVYSLNMMDIPDTLIELWNHFKKVTVNASIDDIENRNFYIRYPTKWEETVSSINKLNNLQNVSWHVTQTVSIFNIYSLDKLSNWLLTTYGKIPHHNYVLYPEYLSIAALPVKYKEELKEYYWNKLTNHQRDELYAKLKAPFDPALLEKAREFVSEIDKVRNLSYKDYIPELKSIL